MNNREAGGPARCWSTGDRPGPIRGAGTPTHLQEPASSTRHKECSMQDIPYPRLDEDQ
jgi:hypothetical protein